MSNHKSKIQIINLKSNLKSIIVFILVLGIGFYALRPNVFAQDVLPLMVMPARTELEVSPGEKTAVTVNFYNKSNNPISGFFKIADFVVLDNKGTPVIVDNFSQVQPRFSASSWMTSTMDRATLPANEKVSFQANIDVPSDAHPGGRYVAIYFEPNSGTLNATGASEEVGTGTSPRIAGLIYIRVKGPINESAIISRFYAPSFLEYGPITVKTDVLNRGDLHIRPRGVVNLTNLFGWLTDQQRFDEQNIFPDTTRTYENQLGSKWMIGRYKVSLDLSYGDQGRGLTSYIYVWVFPWRIAIIIILTLIIIYLFGKHLYKTFVGKETNLEEELKKEKEEIETLKKQIRNRE